MIEIFPEYLENATIQRYTETEGQLGTIMAWSDLTTIQAYMRALSATERSIADKTSVYSTHRMYCEYTDITEKDRVVFNNKTYEVTFVDNKQGDMHIDLKVIV